MNVQNYYFSFDNCSGGLIIIIAPLCQQDENQCREALHCLTGRLTLLQVTEKLIKEFLCQNFRNVVSASVTSLVVRVREWKYGF